MFTYRWQPKSFALALLIATLLLGAVTCVGAALPVTLQDDLGHTINLKTPPQRIVSLAPSITEILFALGLQDQVVAVDMDSNYPPAASKKASVGSGLEPSLERIVALNPDLVLLWDTSSADVQAKITKLRIPTAVFAPQNLVEVYNTINSIGRLAGAEKAAATVVDGMKKKVATVSTTVAKAATKPLVLYEVWPDPLYTVGPGSFMHELITLAGGRNVAADAKSAWPVISVETVVARDPDVVLTPFATEESVVSGKNKNLWAGVKAVRNKRIYTVDQDITSRPGPRLADGLLQIAKALHPDLF